MSDSQVIAQITELDERRAQMVVARDIAGLRQLVGDDLLYVHSSATEEDKALYLERLETGYYRYLGMKNLKRAFRVLGDVVLVNGDVRIDVEVKGAVKLVMSRYLQVWALRDGRWQMVSWQSTPMPAPAAG
ncbi:MAG TPA: nuclear transport factor 2 family protein [Quisquiliibacterium sp.]|nr:MAG: nuclear transport factor 2 family protein [Burkholderiaceae bacterium]HPA91063.1 nuclear transport factor 2 family protein [Quisquiliibacterium sp.]HQN13686.1 nuclear transport factor 2 family protein [Quisquiliibacterium sp.]HQP66963.1 nuclear transport factor 2 family protein [Quisquiliibacterium sp.]